MSDPNFEPQRRGVIKVGNGRGFVVEGQDFRFPRMVITAEHCLPNLPKAFPEPSLAEITYPDLLGPLGEESKVWAECLFVDPVADIAVLGSPDRQEFCEQTEAYETLTDSLGAMPLGRAPHKKRAWLLMLNGHWSSARLEHTGTRGTLQIRDAKEPVESGMSGSPILESHRKSCRAFVHGCKRS